MLRLVGSILSDDDLFKREVVGLLRSGAVPVSAHDDQAQRSGAPPDILVVDGRADMSSALSTIERLRTTHPTVGIFVVALEATPDLILSSMRAGANEFVTWPSPPETFQEAVSRVAARRESSAPPRQQATTLAFLGAKGGAGTTTMAVNCAVELARLTRRPTIVVDLKPGLGEVSLFLGVRSRYSLLDALDNLHRLDTAFLRELVAKHKSGVEILAGSDQFDRPGAGDSGGVEEIFQLLGREYEYVIIDAGAQITPCTVPALYAADTIALVANPDVPSVRNAQRLLDRIRQLGACGDRVRVLLNRAAEPYPIPPAQIESALGHPIYHRFPSDYRTVSSALNSGVPLSLTGNTDLASQVDQFTRKILEAAGHAPAATPPPPGRSTLGLQRVASLW